MLSTNATTLHAIKDTPPLRNSQSGCLKAIQLLLMFVQQKVSNFIFQTQNVANKCLLN